jgi:hypothetical protein
MRDTQIVDTGWRSSISIIIGVGWLIFVILWFAFFATDYPWEKNLSILLLSILIVFLLLGGMWAIWSLRMIPKPGWEMLKFFGFRWHILISIALPFAAMIFLIIWFWYFAEPYSVWQNIAVLLVTILVMGGLLGVLWSRWSMKSGHDMKKFESMGEEFGRKMEETFNLKNEDDSEK